MNDAALQELVSRGDRALRRGDMSEAVRLFEEALRAAPQDEGIQRKLANVRENLQPSELQSVMFTPPPAPAELPPLAVTPEQEGERLFALGDYVGAAAAYRRALRDKPDSELIRERLVELFQLAQAAPRHQPTEQKLPASPEEKLKALLDRISARKKLAP